MNSSDNDFIQVLLLFRSKNTDLIGSSIDTLQMNRLHKDLIPIFYSSRQEILSWLHDGQTHYQEIVLSKTLSKYRTHLKGKI